MMFLVRFSQDFETKIQIDVVRAAVVMLLTLVFGYSQVSYAQSEKSEPTLRQVIEQSDGKVVAREEDQETTTPSKPTGPVDKLDRGVPRTAVQGYLRAVIANEFKEAAEYLDLRNLPRGYSEIDGPELARQLKVILDRALWVELDNLSIDPKGQADDGLPSYRDFIGRINIEDLKVDILLQRVPRGDDVYIWKFSSATVRDIPRLYEEYGYGEIGEKLYRSLPEFKFLTLQL